MKNICLLVLFAESSSLKHLFHYKVDTSEKCVLNDSTIAFGVGKDVLPFLRKRTRKELYLPQIIQYFSSSHRNQLFDVFYENWHCLLTDF